MHITARRACMVAVMSVVMAAMTAWLPMPAFAKTYSHGYLRYNVDDGSATITLYAGREEEVRVPDTIAGKPVNAIAEGAFAGADTVKTVYVPDSVDTIEEGAFAPSQNVVHWSGDIPMRTGIVLDNGGLVTVDREGNLLYVDSEGRERVLDNTNAYKKSLMNDGELIIADVHGNVVSVTDSGEVSFTQANGNTATVDVYGGTETVSSRDGHTTSTYAWEGNAEEGTQVAPDPETGNARYKYGSLIASMAIIAVLAAALLIWKSRS